MEFIDLKQQQALIRSQIDSNIKKVLSHGCYIMGPEVNKLEEQMAEYVGVKHCIGVSSGSDALLISMMALEIGPGDEVITTPFTFIATSEMIKLLGATPVFVDIDPQTYNIDPAKISSAITDNTKLILPVSLYGQCPDMDAINTIAKKHNIYVLEDGAQSFGATYKGRKSCSLSTIGCTSFFPSKPLGCYGDGGAIFTNDDILAKIMREIRIHGQDKRYSHTRLGINGRLDTIQAAILLAKFDIFPNEVAQRNRIGGRYTASINSMKSTIVTPKIKSNCTTVYAQYSIMVNNREQLIDKLKKMDIPTAVHYPIPLHLQPPFYNDQSNFPVAEDVATKIVSLPMHPYLSTKDIEKVSQALVLQDE
jgi:UDP-2-acetamido-2-deoxy-ribo-hexuluronate aminotransferase